MMSFIETYSGYSYTVIHPADEMQNESTPTTTYSVPESCSSNWSTLGNIPRMVNKLLKDMMGRNMESYLADMLIK